VVVGKYYMGYMSLTGLEWSLERIRNASPSALMARSGGGFG